jgi:nucleotide-binding universal stress UspA family protein
MDFGPFHPPTGVRSIGGHKRKERAVVVVVGVDESPHAAMVVRRAIDEARRRNAELHAVYVFHPPVLPYMGFTVDMAVGQRKAVWERIRRELAVSGVDHREIDLEGYPPDVLVGYAKNISAELLVVGTRGRGDFASLVLGSTSHRAIHLSDCDVLVVKGGPEPSPDESSDHEATADGPPASHA